MEAMKLCTGRYNKYLAGQRRRLSQLSRRAMHAIIAGLTPLVVVLPTGGGKSLLFMVPAHLDNTGVTIVVVPY